MASPSPAFVASLVKRLGSEGAMRYLGAWSDAILSGEPVPPIPKADGPSNSAPEP